MQLGIKARAYGRLAENFHYYLSALLAWSLLPATTRLEGRSLLVLGAFLASEVCLIAALTAFDDVTGYRDGSDAINYAPGSGRRRARKPLLVGLLSPAEAVRFGWLMALLGGALFAVALVVAPQRPTWVVVGGWVYVVLAVQYSWGLKISYHGGQEVFIAGIGVAAVLLPYGLLTDAPAGFGVVQALLFGFGPLLFDVYSNINDIAGDAQADRPTLAVKLSSRSYAYFVAMLSVAEMLLIVGAAIARVAPWWFPIVMLPTIGLRAVQLAQFLRTGNFVEARRRGISAHQMTVLLLVVVNIVASYAS